MKVFLRFRVDCIDKMSRFLIFLLYVEVCAGVSAATDLTVVDRIESLDGYAKYLRKANNDDMPPQCRKDLCRRHQTSSPVKGKLDWPEIQVGYEVQQACPWRSFKKVMVTRRCTVGPNGTLEWRGTNLEDCPDPPIKYRLKQLKQEENSTEFNNSDVQADRLSMIYDIYTTYHEVTPFDREDQEITLDFLMQVLPAFQENKKLVPQVVVEQFLIVLDILMKHPVSLSHVLDDHPDIARRLLVQLNDVPALLDVSNVVDGDFTVSGTNLYFYYEMKTQNRGNVFNFNIPNPIESDSDSPYVDNYEIDVTVTKETGTCYVSLLLLKHTEIFRHVLAYTDNVKPVIPTKPSREILQGNNTAIISPGLNLSQGGSPEVFRAPSPGLTTTEDPQTFLIPWGPLLFLDTHVDATALVTYDIKNQGSSSAVCATTQADAPLDWTGSLCTATKSGQSLTCRCGHAFGYGSFLSHDDTPRTTPDWNPTTVNPVGGIDLFLGFPYRKELVIFGQVGNALSLCGLVITVVCYTVIRKAHRGIPTWILMHLSLSLILLTSFTFALESFAHTRVGCAFANAIRYYLVFVSLFWNGIEGFNMYRMLVRIFNSTISRFKLKAAVAAWGIPIVMVGICEAVNHKSFYGQYVLLSLDDNGQGSCAFRCQLRAQTLLFGFVPAMAMILLHNIIIFVLVLRVIIQLGKEGSLSTAKRKSKLSQVVGALATLVLLGVPWLFSAFGVVDANTNSHLSGLETVIQVVFVVCISLQGLFIFLFHCVRNPDIRASWISFVNVSACRNLISSSEHSTESTHEGSLCTNQFDGIAALEDTRL